LSLIEEESEKIREALNQEILGPLKAVLPKLKKYQEMCEKTLDRDALKNGEYKINADFDENLQELAVQGEEIKAKIQKQVQLDLDLTINLDFTKYFLEVGYYYVCTLLYMNG